MSIGEIKNKYVRRVVLIIVAPFIVGALIVVGILASIQYAVCAGWRAIDRESREICGLIRGAW